MSNRITIVWLVVAAILFVTLYVLIRMPRSEVIEFTGNVVSRSTNQGYDGSGDIYVVSLNNGKKITVSTQMQKGIRRGEEVNVLGYERYLLSPSYISIERIEASQ